MELYLNFHYEKATGPKAYMYIRVMVCLDGAVLSGAVDVQYANE